MGSLLLAILCASSPADEGFPPLIAELQSASGTADSNVSWRVAFAESIASTPPATIEPTQSAPAPEPPVEPWLLMRSLQGSRLGSVLADDRIEISGWTDLSLTGSSDRSTNGPLGFNDRAN